MANVKRNQLSTLQVVNLSAPGTYVDGGGLMLRVQPTGSKSWVFRATVNGKRRNYGLGGYPVVTLKAARDRASELLGLAQDGGDPAVALEAHRTPPPPAPTLPTFGEAVEVVIDLRKGSWTNEKHAAQWRSSLSRHVLPDLGAMPVDQISTAEVLGVLTPIWSEKAETATRVKQRMAIIFDYCIAAGWRHDNPCNGALKAALPRRPRQRRHHPAMPYPEVGAALQAVEDANGHESSKLALLFTVLTAARTGEVRAATWDEIDLKGRVWTVPAEHMKMRREHRVPLSTEAVDVLKIALQRTKGRGYLFPSNRKVSRPFSNMALTMLMRRAGLGHFTVHGFRASFRTWALEQTDAPWAVAEAALAHELGGAEVVAYARSDLFERRRELMKQWGTFAAARGLTGTARRA